MRALRLSCVVLAFLGTACLAPGQTPPQVPRPGAGDDFFNLGPTGAQGTPLDKSAAEAAGLGKASGIRIESTLEKTPASGLLLPGDVLFMAAGRPFPPKEDPILFLSQAVEAAEAAKPPVLKLKVLRGGRPADVELTLPALGRHSPTCPKNCPKCAAVLGAALDALARSQGADGGFPAATGGVNGQIAVTSLAGLAFLASGALPDAGPRGKVLKGAVAFVMRNAGQEGMLAKMSSGKGNWSQVNWNLGYAGIFLAEAQKAAGDPAILAKIQGIATQIAANQEATGGWAHGPGGPNALGYLELEIVSNYCLSALGLAKQLGVEADPGAIDRAVKYVVATGAGDGGVGYSTRKGQQGWGDPGRTAGAILAFQALGLSSHPFYPKMQGFFRREMKGLIGGHVSPCMHMLAGSLASRVSGAGDWKAYWDFYRDEAMASRTADGTFSARPTRESQTLHHNTDRGMGPAWITAHFALILQAQTGSLRMWGR
jgi:hypothetical protein